MPVTPARSSRRTSPTPRSSERPFPAAPSPQSTPTRLSADGVVAVPTHQKLPKIAGEPHLLPSLVGGSAPGQSFFPLQDAVHYYGQPVAIVVADSYERAQYGGTRLSSCWSWLSSTASSCPTSEASIAGPALSCEPVPQPKLYRPPAGSKVESVRSRHPRSGAGRSAPICVIRAVMVRY
jgi:hypothetical protein